MFPHERSLVKEMRNKPFILIGVNSDPAAKLKSLIAKKEVTWPCFFDGGDPSGPIASKWNVNGWPTLYLIDKKGIIRGRTFDEILLRKLVRE